MSVVAYRDGIICSDGRMTSGSAIGSEEIRKVAKGPGVIGGFVGNVEELQMYLEWIEKGADLKDIPNGTGTGFVVFDRSTKKKKVGELFIIEKKQFILNPLKRWDYFADGSGYKVAMGALYMGASAQEAVEAAMRHDNNCGGEMYVEELWDVL